MRIAELSMLLLLLGSSLATAQPSSSGFSSGLSGAYAGAINGAPATLTLQQQGNTLSGVIDASGYRYDLAGTVEGSGARGTLTDPQAGGVMAFELAADGGGLTLTLFSTDPFTGEVQHLPFSFRRGEASPPRTAAGTAPGAVVPESGEETGVERDPALVGAWVYSDTYVSGEFSGTTRLYLQVNPDGSYLYGNGRVTAGGSNSLGSYSGDTGNSGDVTRGQWRTQGNVVYVKENGAGAWVPYARYHVEGARMLFTFGDGSRQLWSRQ